MKIAYDAKRFFNNSSGLGNYSRDLVRILSKFYPQNNYILFNKNISQRGAEILASENVNFLSLGSGKFSRQLEMGKKAQESGADIFHGLSGELPIKWTNKPIKKIVTIHDLIFLRYPDYYSFFDRKIHHWKFKKAAENADLVIAISEQTKKDIVKFLQIPERNICVVYQGCHQAFKEKANEHLQQNLRKEFNLPARFLLTVGTIEPRKNLANILTAISGTDLPLVVVGRKQEKYFREIQKIISKNNIQKHIFFLEKINTEELAELYKMADIFLYPSYFEGFGIPVIEALFSATSVITGNTSSLPEAGGSAAMYVDPKNPEDIRSKILFLWENESERKRRAEIGLEYVKKFEDAQVAASLMKVYQDVLK